MKLKETLLLSCRDGFFKGGLQQEVQVHCVIFTYLQIYLRFIAFQQWNTEY